MSPEPREPVERPLRYRTFNVVDEIGQEWTIVRLLALLIVPVTRSRWTVDVEMAPGAAADRALVHLSDDVDGLTLINALALDPQVIEGDLIGRDGAGEVQLVLRAVDGAHWDVLTDDDNVIAELESTIIGIRGEGLN